MQDNVRTEIEELVKKNQVVLFMKGNRHFPQCGFSATVVKILDGYLPKYQTVNVLQSPDMRDGIKEYSSWPTIPQLYIDGKFVGGCDIIKDLEATGELAKLLGANAKDAKPVTPPTIVISDEAAKAIAEAQKEADGDPLRVAIGPRYEYDLFFDKKVAADVAVTTKGVTFLFDVESVERAGELTVDFVASKGFRVESSKAPARPKTMEAGELKTLLASKSPLFLLDVRPDGERALAAIAGHVAMSPEVLDKVASLPKDTKIVVYCHHGHRSMSVASQLVDRGIKNVFNLDGGVEAYSDVDSSIPKY